MPKAGIIPVKEKGMQTKEVGAILHKYFALWKRILPTMGQLLCKTLRREIASYVTGVATHEQLPGVAEPLCQKYLFSYGGVLRSR